MNDNTPIILRDAAGHFLPGSNPNPTGSRPRSPISIIRALQQRLQENPSEVDDLITSLLKLANKPDANALSIIMERIDGKVPNEMVVKGVIAHIGNEYAQQGLEANRLDLESRKLKYNIVDAEVKELPIACEKPQDDQQAQVTDEVDYNPLLETINRIKLGTNKAT